VSVKFRMRLQTKRGRWERSVDAKGHWVVGQKQALARGGRGMNAKERKETDDKRHEIKGDREISQ